MTSKLEKLFSGLEQLEAKLKVAKENRHTTAIRRIQKDIVRKRQKIQIEQQKINNSKGK